MTHWVEPNNMLTKAFNTLTYVYENTIFKEISKKVIQHVSIFHTTCLFQVVDLLDVAALGRLQLADVPVLIPALLEECR